MIAQFQKISPEQKLLWDEWNEPTEEIHEVAEKFVLANCFDPKIASQQFNKATDKELEEKE